MKPQFLQKDRAQRYARLRPESSNSRTPKLLLGRARYALFAFGTVAAVTVAMAWNPPTGSVHKFTSASDYRVEKESGCTNSGAGCHGDETSYQDFNAYHPETDCTTCHDYEGVGCIPCHSPREHECALCHDGSMKNAPDRVRITDPYPQGHYRETTHTAVATDMDQSVRVAKSGKAKAACGACHSSDLREAHTAVPVADGSPYGPEIGCGECHNDVRSFGQAEVLSDWQVRSCESCHKVGSSTPMHGIDKLEAIESEDEFGCTDSGAGCHAEKDLHLLHVDAPSDCSGSASKGEPGCHNLDVESHVPEARGCGGDEASTCHRSSDPEGYVHEASDVHSPKTGAPASNRSFYAVACGECHYMDADGSSLISEHERATSAISGETGDLCVDCHNHEGSAETIENEWGDRDTSRSCPTCHDGSGIDAAHSGDIERAHDSSDSEGCAASGAGCHPGTSLAGLGEALGDQTHDDCLTCHAKRVVASGEGYEPGKRTCGEDRDCHASSGAYDPATSIHRTDGVIVNGSDNEHHTATETQASAALSDKASGITVRCSECHVMSLGEEHARTNSAIASSSCAGCHNATTGTAGVVKGDWVDKDAADACAACHDGAAAPVQHEAIGDTHIATQIGRDGTIQATYCSRSGCHETADVRVLHRDSGCGMAGCHRSTGDIRGMGVMTCGGSEGQKSCHLSNTRHEGKDAAHLATEIDRHGTATPGACQRAGCHATIDVRQLHEQTHCETPGCHVEDGPTYMTCGGVEGQAGACHGGSARHSGKEEAHQATTLDRYGNPSPTACQRAGCHATIDVRQLHEQTHCETPGCHVEGGPTYMTCGGVEDSSSSCHPTIDETYHPQSHASDLLGSVEGVTYGPGENAGCVGSCHTTDLITEHRTRWLAGSIEGGGETVCRMCHEGGGAGTYAALAAVTNAIATADRRCVACHASGSEVDGPHAVGSPTAACVPSSILPSVEAFRTATAGALKRRPSSRVPAHEDEPSDAPASEPTSDSATEPSESATATAPVEEKPDEVTTGSDESDPEKAPEPDCTRISDDETETAETAGSDREICLSCHEVSSERSQEGALNGEGI